LRQLKGLKEKIFIDLACGLRVNFSKTCLVGVHVDDSFLRMAEGFFHCRLGSFPYKCLGSRLEWTHILLEPGTRLINLIEYRLNSWTNRFVSLRGRVVLINPFLKMSVKVWKHIVRLQRYFLWGGSKGGNKISRVSWSDICKPKRERAFRVRDLRRINLALLGKWRCRILAEGDGLWRSILSAMYGSAATSCHFGMRGGSLKSALPWWKWVSLLSSKSNSSSLVWKGFVSSGPGL